MNESAPKRSAIILLFSVVSLMIGGALGYFGARPRGAPPITISTPVPTATSSPTATPSPIRVYVSGAVQAPGVYELEQGCIVADAIQVAGGAAAADLPCGDRRHARSQDRHAHQVLPGEPGPPVAPRAREPLPRADGRRGRGHGVFCPHGLQSLTAGTGRHVARWARGDPSHSDCPASRILAP